MINLRTALVCVVLCCMRTAIADDAAHLRCIAGLTVGEWDEKEYCDNPAGAYENASLSTWHATPPNFLWRHTAARMLYSYESLLLLSFWMLCQEQMAEPGSKRSSARCLRFEGPIGGGSDFGETRRLCRQAGRRIHGCIS